MSEVEYPRYFLKNTLGDMWHEVHKDAYLDAERSAGFVSKSPGKPATASFSASIITGKVAYSEFFVPDKYAPLPTPVPEEAREHLQREPDPEPGQESLPVVVVETALGCLHVLDVSWAALGQPVTVLLRPEAARLVEEGTEPEGIIVAGRVVECSFRGGHCRLVLRHDAGLELAFALSSDLARLPEPGQAVVLALRPSSISLLASETDG